MARLRMLLKTYATVIANPSPGLRINSAKQSLSLFINYPQIAASPEPALSLVEEAPRKDLRLFRLKTLWRIGAAVFVFLLLAPALALAHGGMGEELGPPIMTSGLLGFVGYWVVMLWPSAKKKDDQEDGVNGQNLYTSRTDRRSHKRSVRVKRAPRLRKIEGRGPFGSDQNTRRKASDG